MFDNQGVPGVCGEPDNLLKEAVEVCVQYERASASLLQRRLSIGYARAARVMDQLQDAGVLAPSDGTSRPREVLIKSIKEFEIRNGKVKSQEEKENYTVPYKRYVPVVADFLPEEVKKLINPLDLPYINTGFKKTGNLIVIGNVISKKYDFIKTYLLFLLSKFNLDNVRLVIDDHTTNLNKFDNIPHLLSPIIDDSSKSLSALRWLTREMDRRIELLNKNEDEKLPVIIYIGTIFNLYSIEIEDAIKRLSSMGAYAGIHLILTGDRLGDFPKMIKDNIPARLEFNKFGEHEAIFTFNNKGNIKLDVLDKNKIEKYLDKCKTTD
jgi:DNA segregation ATPase FtsK/SpoIIIE-like protein